MPNLITSGGGAAPAIPAGVIVPFGGAGAVPPTGWLLCDGASLLRATFAGLFAVIGIQYGSVDGTHFNVPDFRTNESLPKGALIDADRGNVGGVQTVTLTISQMPVHNHLQRRFTTGSNLNGVPGIASTATPVATSTPTTNSTGGGTSHSNEAPFVVVNYLIKT